MQGAEANALRTPVTVSYARALVRALGKTRGERDELLKGTAIDVTYHFTTIMVQGK